MSPAKIRPGASVRLMYPAAVVVGLDCITGLQTARLLAKHDLFVIGVASDPKHFCARTNVCDLRVQSSTSTPELIEALEALSAEVLPCKAVLYPCSDAAVMQISANRARLQNSYHMALPRHEVVEMLTSKPALSRYAREQGFRVPLTLDVRNETDLAMAAATLRFPCTLKPAVKDARWLAATRTKAFRVESKSELATIYRRCAAWSEHLVVQEWIEGGESELYSCNCYFAKDGEPVATFVSRKERQWPPDTGTSASGIECRNDVVRSETLRLFQSVGYHGLGYVEMKRDARTGEHVLIEPNIGRPTGRSAIAEAGGVELLFAMYCDLVGHAMPRRLIQRYREAKWIYLRHDLQAAYYRMRRGELSLGDWWQFMRGPKAYAVWSRADPVPFLFDLGKAVSASPVGSSRVDLQACKLEYSIVSPK